MVCVMLFEVNVDVYGIGVMGVFDYVGEIGLLGVS